MRIKTGDNVIILNGKDKGKTGEVSKVYPVNSTVTVKGINLQTKHRKPSSTNKSGGRERTEHPVNASNVALLRPGSKTKGTRIGVKVSSSGKKTRVARQADNKEIK